jgi:hypothetical protein
MDRRAFLKNSLVALAGAGSVSSLAGCNGEFYGKKIQRKPTSFSSWLTMSDILTLAVLPRTSITLPLDPVKSVFFVTN